VGGERVIDSWGRSLSSPFLAIDSASQGKRDV